jgi:outer membrane immunogenic protein
VTVSRKKNEADQVAQSIDQRHGFGGQAATRSADSLILSPPFAPVPCRWTLTIVPSMSAYSMSGSPDRALKTFSNTPLSAQRRKRFQTVNHLPKSSGRSRQGAPVRTIHKIPSRDRRLSSPLRPGSPFLPGRSGAIRCHWDAADLALKTKAPAPAARAFNWTGCYVGVNAGGGASGSNFTTTVDSGTHLTDPGDLAAVSASGSNSINDSSFMGGGQLGCSLQTGSLVFGIEGDADYFRTSPNVTTTGTLSTGETYAVTNTVTTNGFATLRPRFGIASDRTFVFLTGGAAFTRATFTQGYTDTSGGAGSSSMSTSLVGWTAGAGVEYAWTDHWSLKGEYLFASFPTKSFVTGIADAAGGTNLLHGAADLTIQSARLGVNYKF